MCKHSPITPCVWLGNRFKREARGISVFISIEQDCVSRYLNLLFLKILGGLWGFTGEGSERKWVQLCELTLLPLPARQAAPKEPLPHGELTVGGKDTSGQGGEGSGKLQFKTKPR